MDGLIYVLAGGLVEPVWVCALERFGAAGRPASRAAWATLAAVGMFGSLMLLSFGMNEGVAIGVGYAIWTAVGSVFTIALGRMLFAERLHRKKVLAVTMIIAGIAGLHLAGGIG